MIILEKGADFKLEFYNQNKEIFDIHLVMCGKERNTQTFKMPPHLREYYLIHYIQRGGFIFEENQKLHLVEEGDIFIIYPDTLTSYRNANSVEFSEYCWIGFLGDGVERYLEYAGVTRENPVIHINNTDFENAVLMLVNQFETKHSISEITLNSYLLKCFQSIEKSINPNVVRNVNYVKAAMTYIEDNYMKDISAADISEFVMLNRSYLFKIFKKQTGLSVSQYLIRYRINKACEFFREYNFNVSQVAQMVGIDDIFYFSKLFKKFKGITPTEYKKRQDS